MKTISYNDFEKNIDEIFNSIFDEKVVKIKRGKGKSIVLMSEKEFNSIQETLYLESTKTNRKRLEEAINQMNRF